MTDPPEIWAAEDLGRPVRRGFAQRYGRDPLVVGRAPGRVNLIGEHTDYNGGLCLPVALPHATWAAVAPRDDHLLRVSSAQLDEVWEGSVQQLRPGTEGWAAYVAGVVWAMREAGWDVRGLDVHVDSRVPVGGGLSSSAALECSVAVALAELAGLPWEQQRLDLARMAISAETDYVGAATGGIDQTVALLAEPGHALLIDFAGGGISATQVPAHFDEDGLALLVVDTRVSHSLVGGDYPTRRRECEEAARRLGVDTLPEASLDRVEALEDPVLRARARHVVTEVARVRQAADALRDRDWSALGAVLTAGHASMRDDFDATCAELDAAAELAEAHGALGARMVGGGWGGSVVALVEHAERDQVAVAVRDGFAQRGFTPPAFIEAVASGPASLA